MIQNKGREVTLVYHSQKYDDNKALAFAESLQGVSVKTLDLAKDKLTETQLKEIADKMEGEVVDLVDFTNVKDIPELEEDAVKEMDEGSLLTLMAQNQKLIDTPLLITDKIALQFGSSYDLVREKLGDLGVKSEKANVQEKPPEKK